jgi:polysaccharide pyruvyl transferase CsaB
VNFFLSGYYGYGNAGDEAVLAAILEAVGACSPGASFTVASGDPDATSARFSTTQNPVRAVPRQSPKPLAQAIRACDVFISGGGSLLQDVTSLRNVVYYTSLIRFARLSGKPVVIYAHGVGPLRRTLSQKLARAAIQIARVVSVRDDESKALLQRIGVRRAIEVTADPVWALSPQKSSTRRDMSTLWALGLRPWPGYEFEAVGSGTIQSGLHEAAQKSNARLRFVPMQASSDAVISDYLRRAGDEAIDTSAMHPREIMGACGDCDAMISMRLHALIFAAAQRVPCVAINYDPKVEALAQIIGAPLLPDLSASSLQSLPAALESARPINAELLNSLQQKALRTAELAAGVR